MVGWWAWWWVWCVLGDGCGALVFALTYLDDPRLQNFLPPVEALDVGAPYEIVGDALPVLAVVRHDRAFQELVLFRRPVALRVERGVERGVVRCGEVW